MPRSPINLAQQNGQILQLATSDVALLHTTILLSANHWIRTGRDPSVVSATLLHHKVEAIRIINERLDDNSMAVLDGTIGAVASMALAEVSKGTYLKSGWI